MEAAALAARQQWWLLTAAATAGGLGLIIFAKLTALRVLGVALIVVPHLIGAPAAPHASSGVPAELAAEFAIASLAVAAAFWLLLGSLSGWLFSVRARIISFRKVRAPVPAPHGSRGSLRAQKGSTLARVACQHR